MGVAGSVGARKSLQYLSAQTENIYDADHKHSNLSAYRKALGTPILRSAKKAPPFLYKH